MMHPEQSPPTGLLTGQPVQPPAPDGQMGQPENLPRLEVLVSTWNGEPFVREQLESLFRQEGAFHLHIRVRDDGSSDDTVHRVSEVTQRFAGRPDRTCAIESGENLGFVRSFFTLLSCADEQADYVAFCDQDDVWLPNKLARAIEALRAVQEDKADPSTPASPPLLYTSRLQLVDRSLQPIGYSRLAGRAPAFANALVENIVTGATLVMNQAARRLVLQGLSRMSSEPALDADKPVLDADKPVLDADKPCQAVATMYPDSLWKHILLHDWWCYLVVSAFGQVIYDPDTAILYRQHGNNQVGQGVSFLARQKKRLRRFLKAGHLRGITQQAALFDQLHAAELNGLSSELVKAQLAHFLSRNDAFRKRLAYAIAPTVWRQAWYDNLLLRVLLLFNRI